MGSMKRAGRLAAVAVTGIVALFLGLNLEVGASSRESATAEAPPKGGCADPEYRLAIGYDVDEEGKLICRYEPGGLSPFTEDCANPAFRRDGKRIPRVLYEGRYVYNPGTVAMCGLGEYNYYFVTRNWVNKGARPPEDADARLAYAVAVADWLVQTQERSSGKWYYHYMYPVGGTEEILEPPWASAYAQGVAMSLLTRVYRSTFKRTYLEAAIRAARPLRKDVAAGGLRADLFGHPFYEEYPTQPPTFALAGFMDTLLGLYDLRETLREGGEEATAAFRDVETLYEQGLATLEYALPFYDLGTSSAYHLGHLTHPPRAVSSFPAYHPRHVAVLRLLHSITGRAKILFYAKLWGTYEVDAE
jgi:D-glucuronyl C5-epimerase C-terminus